MQRAGRVVPRALIEQADMGLVGQPRTQLSHQPRLPIPGSPNSRTTCPSPSLACCHRRSSRAIFSSRPTSGVSPAPWRASKRLSALPSPATRQARTGSAKP
jgi:hypothetical protein